MIIRLADGSSIEFFKKDLKPFRLVMISLRKFIISLLKNGYSSNSLNFEDSNDKTNREIKIEDVVFSCLPQNIKSHLSNLTVTNFKSICCNFSFKKDSNIPLKFQDMIIAEINKILNEENRKLLSKIRTSVQTGNRLIEKAKKDKLMLKKKLEKFNSENKNVV